MPLCIYHTGVAGQYGGGIYLWSASLRLMVIMEFGVTLHVKRMIG